ncbi:hypothetical protein E2C01_088695 [Portunus trituberculatus]|uniref:Uncharacterized protein n=1 Tax=Portunus trituberculatus TaxID=210409 RepID=A0A5B7JBF7_PORTR|nr:hypothetical protein [Portunus trituberculatus]
MLHASTQESASFSLHLKDVAESRVLQQVALQHHDQVHSNHGGGQQDASIQVLLHDLHGEYCRVQAGESWGGECVTCLRCLKKAEATSVCSTPCFLGSVQGVALRGSRAAQRECLREVCAVAGLGREWCAVTSLPHLYTPRAGRHPGLSRLAGASK